MTSLASTQLPAFVKFIGTFSIQDESDLVSTVQNLLSSIRTDRNARKSHFLQANKKA